MDGVDGPVAWQMETSRLRVRDAAVSSAEGGPVWVSFSSCQQCNREAARSVQGVSGTIQSIRSIDPVSDQTSEILSETSE
jgi:hypothetical protein